MTTFAIGDVHGRLDALRDLLGQVEPELTAGDVVVFVGDYIDRGPDSRTCVDEVLAFRDRARAEVICLLGNHEDWLLKTMADYSKHSWLLGMEALTTIRSYSEEAERAIVDAMAGSRLALYMEQVSLPYDLFVDAMPESHRAFFRSLQPMHMTADAICTHAGVNPEVPAMENQSTGKFTWGAQGFPDRYDGQLPIVYGHFNNAVLADSGWPHPRITEKTIGLDTIAHGVLTAVRVSDRRVFQSGRTRLPPEQKS